MQIHSALVGAYGRFQSAGEQLTAFEQGIVREAEEALKASELAFQLGERGILEVLDAQRVLRTVRLQFLIARYDRQLALVEINELKATALVADAATAVPADSKK
jgi:cobalt-zinc-cadmium efflux system outer membrane protein